MEKPQRGGHPGQRGAHEWHDGEEEGEQRQQRGAGHARNDKTDPRHHRLSQRCAQYAIDDSADRFARHGQEMCAPFAADAFHRGGQAFGGGNAVAEQEERDENAQRQFHQAAPERESAFEQP